jgi:hypothetical protein
MFGGDEERISDDCRGMFLVPDDKPVIWLRHLPRNNKQVASMVHEAFHATCYFMRHVGIKYCGKSEEAFAYTLDHIVESILNKVK